MATLITARAHCGRVTTTSLPGDTWPTRSGIRQGPESLAALRRYARGSVGMCNVGSRRQSSRTGSQTVSTATRCFPTSATGFAGRPSHGCASRSSVRVTDGAARGPRRPARRSRPWFLTCRRHDRRVAPCLRSATGSRFVPGPLRRSAHRVPSTARAVAPMNTPPPRPCRSRRRDRFRRTRHVSDANGAAAPSIGEPVIDGLMDTRVDDGLESRRAAGSADQAAQHARSAGHPTGRLRRRTARRRQPGPLIGATASRGRVGIDRRDAGLSRPTRQ